jgi:hypothetical protein
MSEPIKAVEVLFEIVEVKTMVDNSTKVIMNIPEQCKKQATEIFKHSREMAKAVIQFTDEQ